MSAALNLFDARRSKWTQPDGSLTFEAQIFLRDLWLRAGGAIGPGTVDLAASAFEDAGIAEQLDMIVRLGDAGLQNPPVPDFEQRIEAIESTVSQLLAQVDELTRAISGMQQGTML